eukprot:1952154-Amphidinium_carterae.2
MSSIPGVLRSQGVGQSVQEERQRGGKERQVQSSGYLVASVAWQPARVVGSPFWRTALMLPVSRMLPLFAYLAYRSCQGACLKPRPNRQDALVFVGEYHFLPWINVLVMTPRRTVETVLLRSY